MFLSFLRLGAGAFGGPAMVAYIRNMSVGRRRWMDGNTFDYGVALCQSIPGATAMQTAAYVGFRVRGLAGALASYAGFGLPAFLFMLLLSSLYVRFRNLDRVMMLFSGLQVVVVALIANGAVTYARNTLKRYADSALAILSAILFWSGANPFLVIAGAAAAGIVFFKADGQWGPSEDNRQVFHVKHLAVAVSLPGLALLFLYVVHVKLAFLALVMIKIDFFAFGGGFAALPLMLHQVTEVYGWMDRMTFMDGIALGQITPGPIVITATFVGYLLNGLSGAVISTLAMFTPSFLVLLATMPVFDRLRRSFLFGRALRAILATFVGLLVYVAVKFGLTVTWDLTRVLLGLSALGLLLGKVDVLYVVLAGGAASVFFVR